MAPNHTTLYCITHDDTTLEQPALNQCTLDHITLDNTRLEPPSLNQNTLHNYITLDNT